MSPTLTTGPGYEAAQTLPYERRSRQRFSINLDVEYKVPTPLGNGALSSGFGRTVNISSTGVLFDIDAAPPDRCPIHLSIDWPFFLDESIPLKLVMHAKVIRVEGKRVAVEVNNYAFHTAAHGHHFNQQ